MSAQATLTGAPAGAVIAVPASELPLSLLADLFTRCYAGYFVPIEVDASALSRLVCTQNVDLVTSQVLIADGEPAALLLAATRGYSQRVAAMAVLPEHRRKGLARLLMEQAVSRARTQGMSRLLLEVIEENEPAVTLYRSLGFEISRRLVGYERPADADQPDAESADDLTEVDPHKVAQVVAWEGDPGLPWQRCADTLFATQPPSRAYRLETAAFAIVTERSAEQMVIDTILVVRAKRRQGWGRRLLNALLARYPERSWAISATVPEDLADAFLLATGFQRSSISQLEMVLDLGEPGEQDTSISRSGP